ncbi:single-stranded DNA-binding protein [Parabacteroides provencensis]|uniref:single-stranded DNA-binding protein n=1 Tax=Parabacteroides provencensis TaxID=1944636 RepID=UPI000C150CAC|nr:single-stranded DNA-binding protein [Parabacteroides provencensis]
MSVNKVILLGYTGKDPEVKEVAGTKVANISLATTEKGYALQNGTQIPDRTEWHSLVFWKGLAEVVEKFVKKGSQIFIEGKIKTRIYEDKTGSKRYVTEIFVDKLDLLGSKSTQQEANPQPESFQSNPSDDLPF